MRIYCDANKNEFAIVCDCGKVERLSGQFGDSHNVNEYKAILLAINHLNSVHTLEHVEICSDSQLAVEQLNHHYSINESHLRKLAEECWKAKHEHDTDSSFVWLPRKDNKAGKFLG